MNNKRYSKQYKQPKKKFCFIEKNKIEQISYRDHELLDKFCSSNNKIIAARITGTTPKQQRKIAREIKNSRYMAFRGDSE